MNTYDHRSPFTYQAQGNSRQLNEYNIQTSGNTQNRLHIRLERYQTHIRLRVLLRQLITLDR